MTSPNFELLNRKEILGRIKDLEGMDWNQSEEEGFILLAGALRLMDNAANGANEGSMSNDELNDCITDAAWGFPGRRGDGGLDAFWVNDTDRQLCLFQSKLETYTRKELADFLTLPGRLTTKEFVSSVQNDAVKEASFQFVDKLNDGYGIRLYFTTTGTQKAPDKRFVEDWNAYPIAIPMPGGTVLNPAHSAHFMDRQDLSQRLIGNATPSSADVDLEVRLDCSFFHENGNSRMLICLVEAKELCRIYDENRFNIFRNNPRAVLESSKVNPNIRATLDNDDKKFSFHLLNNGLNITCTKLEYPGQISSNKTTYKSKIEDFQIVNGLQTTFTLHQFKIALGDLDGVYVVCKISESPSLNYDISVASNSQNVVTGWDLVSLSDTQKRLQEEFNAIPQELRERRFYEIRRGEAKSQRSLPPNTPLVKPKELTQIMVAFMGNPVVAKNQMKEIENNINSANGDYQVAFKDATNGYHLLLAWKSWLYVKNRIQELNKQYALTNTNPPEWLNHSRFHIHGLIGRGYIAKHSVGSFLEVSQISLQEDLANMDTWLEDLYNRAYNAIDFIQQAQQMSDDDQKRIFRPRQIFLAQNSWHRMQERLPGQNASAG